MLDLFLSYEDRRRIGCDVVDRLVDVRRSLELRTILEHNKSLDLLTTCDERTVFDVTLEVHVNELRCISTAFTEDTFSNDFAYATNSLDGRAVDATVRTDAKHTHTRNRGKSRGSAPESFLMIFVGNKYVTSLRISNLLLALDDLLRGLDSVTE